jgi:hypothetical protein
MSTFYLLFSGMAVVLLASWPGLVVSSRPAADDSVKAGNHEAVKKDFLNWVAKVGEALQAHVQSLQLPEIQSLLVQGVNTRRCKLR